MNVTLSPQLEALVRKKVETGTYADAHEVIREALELLDERDRFERLRLSLIEAEEQIERGESEEWSPKLMARLIKQGDELYRQGIRPNPDVCP